jgi:hypothetical protein
LLCYNFLVKLDLTKSMKPSFKDRTPPSDSQIRDYFQILKKDSKSRVFAALAEALIRRGRLTEAEDICKLGLEANPEFSDGHLAYARVLFYLFRYQEAFAEVKLALGLDKDNVEAYLIAAEIFLARSQHKACSEACLKVIDLDPENEEARKLLKRIGAAGKPGKAGAKTVEKEPPERMSTDSFKATAGTSPGRRALKKDAKPSLSDPFRQLLHETGEQAAEKLDTVEQPFSAMSSGSQPPGPPDLFDDDLEEPTKREKSPRRPDGTPIPKLPEHPPTPVPVPDPDPVPETASSPSSGPAMVDRIQSVIDSYTERQSTDPHDYLDPPKIPRAGRILSLLGLLALLAAIGFAIVYGLRSEVRSGVDKATEQKEAGTSLLLTDAPPAPPEPPPPEEEVVPEPEPEPEPEVVPDPDPDPVPEIKKKPKKKKKKRKKRKKRRKRRRRRR